MDRLVVQKGKKTVKKFEFIVSFMEKINKEGDESIKFEKN